MTRHERFDVRPAPTSPWVISTRELGRRAGAMRTCQRTIPAPEGFRLGVIGIPEGAPIELDLRLEAASEGVFVSGTATADLAGECSRCLEPLTDRVQARLGELFAYPDSATDATTGADEVSRVVDELVDTEPMVRDAVLLGLPLAPVCREDCRGLCPDCGERWADLDPSHGHETIDHRWAVLRGLLASTTDAEPDAQRRR